MFRNVKRVLLPFISFPSPSCLLLSACSRQYRNCGECALSGKILLNFVGNRMKCEDHSYLKS